jgi:hypothetical protein
METSDTVMIDPALTAAMPTYPAAEPGTQRYFEADDGDCQYTIVARDRAHAEQILRDSGIEFGDPSVPFDQAEIEWTEIVGERAATIRVRDDDNRGTMLDGHGWPLDTFRPGDWFSSEW